MKETVWSGLSNCVLVPLTGLTSSLEVCFCSDSASVSGVVPKRSTSKTRVKCQSKKTSVPHVAVVPTPPRRPYKGVRQRPPPLTRRNAICEALWLGQPSVASPEAESTPRTDRSFQSTRRSNPELGEGNHSQDSAPPLRLNKHQEAHAQRIRSREQFHSVSLFNLSQHRLAFSLSLTMSPASSVRSTCQLFHTRGYHQPSPDISFSSSSGPSVFILPQKESKLVKRRESTDTQEHEPNRQKKWTWGRLTNKKGQVELHLTCSEQLGGSA